MNKILKIDGFSIIELLVGIAIGLIIVATSTVMFADMLKSQKETTASARLNQELGAAMAIMSNEIRRAGFRMCNSDGDPATADCKVIDVEGVPVELPFMPAKYAYADVIKIDGGGGCIEYRYNADTDVEDVDKDVGEQRGFRLNSNTNTIQISDPTVAVSCADALTSNNWLDLTNPDMVEVMALSFTTTGSKCINMEKSRNWYWEVGDGATGLACNISSPVTCTPLIEGMTACDATLVETGDNIYGTHQIVIEVNARLSRDPLVVKHTVTSVKLENPWVGKSL